MIYDSELNPTDETPLLEARGSLEASIALEGKPAAGDVPEQIKGKDPIKKFFSPFILLAII